MDSRVNIVFLENGTMTVQCPYNKDFLEVMRENSIPRIFNRAEKKRYFHGKHAGDVYKLLEDYYP